MRTDGIEIKMFPAQSGDCILISFIKEDFRILIDGGYGRTYDDYLKPHLIKLAKKGKKLDLVIATHIDRDHIGGIKKLLKENGKADAPEVIPIGEIWFNGFKNVPAIKKKPGDNSLAMQWRLQTMAANNCEEIENGTENISYQDGNCLADLINENRYSWNKAFSEIKTTDAININVGVVARDVRMKVEYGKIHITVLNPTIEDLDNLGREWIDVLKQSCKGDFTIQDNHLFSSAFEGYFLFDKDYNSYCENVSFYTEKEINWIIEADEKDAARDRSLQNQSSIAILIEYEGKTLLFPGDCAIEKILDYQSNDSSGCLPESIDVVKLPHHGSGKSNLKNFIRKYAVGYYLLSSDGSYGHPSKMIIGNIICNAKGKAEIVKNYDLPMLKGVGTMWSEMNNI